MCNVKGYVSVQGRLASATLRKFSFDASTLTHALRAELHFRLDQMLSSPSV